MRILDIDMDFFLDEIETWIPFNNERLSEKRNHPWNEKDFRHFLEFNCGLSQKNPIKGRIIIEHKDAYYFWRELIRKRALTIPFEVIHIDAHSDLGGGDNGYVFIFEKVLNMPLEKRSEVENFRYSHERQKLDSGNYLLYAAACHWIKSLTLVCHPKWKHDYYPFIMKNSKDDSGYIQLKRFPEKIDFSVQNINNTKQDFDVDGEIEFKIVHNYQSYVEPKINTFDYLVFCQSPSYTPASADFMLEAIKDYINIT